MSTFAVIVVIAGVLWLLAVLLTVALCRSAAIADEHDAELMRRLRERD